jgi:hypothetical protein
MDGWDVVTGHNPSVAAVVRRKASGVALRIHSPISSSLSADRFTSPAIRVKVVSYFAF